MLLRGDEEDLVAALGEEGAAELDDELEPLMQEWAGQQQVGVVGVVVRGPFGGRGGAGPGARWSAGQGRAGEGHSQQP